MQSIFKFCKMHGLGNDFVIINAVTHPITLDEVFIRKLSCRHTGIGFDQLLLIEPSSIADFSCRIFNADGSIASQCGNGMRCVARFVLEEQLIDKKTLTIQTKSGIVEVIVKDFDHITVDMGQPTFAPSSEIILDKEVITLSVLSMGNPHAILQVKSLKDISVSHLGPTIATHSIFPQGVNVGFMQIINRNKIRLRTVERGVGETLACGSNACAAVVSGIESQLLDSRVEVELALGSLWIEWAGKGSHVMMTGPASRVFQGEVLK